MISLARVQKAALLWPVPRREIKAMLESLLENIGRPGAEVEICLVMDQDMAALNQTYLNCQGPTNILSFGENPHPNNNRLGTLVLSVETARRETRLYGQNLTGHCCRLICHGLLHLAGYDHGPAMDEMMEKAIQGEEKVFLFAV